MSLKEWTELSKDKHKLWADFNWTLKDCREAPSVAAIMKLELVAGNLVRDYLTTAEAEERKGQRWNSLSEKQKEKFIRHWGYEKARIENGYIDEWERLEKQGEQYLKEIEMAKFHEERGKKGCECWQCAGQEAVRAEVKAEQEKIISDYEAEQKKSGEMGIEWVEGDCNECGEYKKVDSDSGLCRSCESEE
jgi:hypothetical protein